MLLKYEFNRGFFSNVYWNVMNSPVLPSSLDVSRSIFFETWAGNAANGSPEII